MAKVSLRVYNREIESMIEGGQLEEAVAHCQHILRTFPMHVETYRLLGKSFLETRRYTDAADIFQRTLMAVPDDFVAHVGMSIIRDDEGKLDDAIWHMERAFEGQPSNPAIQGELRRLYGRRDGVEPPKIRLSRDALANMYAQGELFNQAIAEIRAVLAEDANRPDLQVMLARAYYRSGQKVEAAEMAANLLKKYTYCLDALRILVDVLPGGSGTENTQVYQQRLRLLDPYSSFTTDSVFNTNQVVDTAVTLERLEYTASTTPASSQPNWASSLGITLTDEKRAEQAPDWLKASDSSEPNAAGTPASSVPAVPAADSQSVPDWMRSGGWQESNGNAQESPVDIDADQSGEQLAKADIPDWLKAMAPQEIMEAEAGSEPIQAVPQSSSDGDIPDWLAGTKDAAAQAKPGSEPTSTVVPPPGEENIPDLLSGTETVPTRANAAPEPMPANISATIDEELPDWLKETKTEATGSSTETSQLSDLSQDNGTIPDWLKEMSKDSPTGTAVAFAADALNQIPESNEPPQPPAVEQVSVEPTISKSLPDEEVPFQPTGESKPLNIEDDTMAWLESLAAKQGAKEEELLTKPEERSEVIPDWLRPVVEQPVPPTTLEASSAPIETKSLDSLNLQAESLIAQEPAPSGELPPVQSPAEGIAQPLSIEDDTMAWLEGLAAKQGAKEEELLSKPEDRSDEIPEWLRSASEQPSESTIQEPASTAGESQPVEAVSAHAGEFEAQEQLAPDAFQAPPEEGMEDIPDWLRMPGEPSASVDKLDLTPSVGEAVPLDALSPQTGEFSNQESVISKDLPATPENGMEDIPGWLRSAREEPASSVMPEPIPAPIETPAKGSVATLSEGNEKPVEEDETLAWLGDQEAKQGSKLEDMQTVPSEGSAAPTGWIEEMKGETAAPEKEPAPEIPQEDMSITSWLSKLDVDEALGKTKSASEAQPAEAESSPELPDWLKELEKTAAPEEATKPVEPLPDWLRQPANLVSQETPAAVVPEPTPEPELPIWTDEEIPVSDQPAATTPGEWVPLEEKPAQAPVIEPANEAVAIPVVEPIVTVSEPQVQPRVPKGTGMLARIPAQDKDAEFLAGAQAALDANKLNEAMKGYAALIKKNRLLDEVIHDLREAIYRFPVDIIVWQTLGDACMRANRLQDALDAYTKAEELLR